VTLATTLDDLYRLWATCDAENVVSARVLEKADSHGKVFFEARPSARTSLRSHVMRLYMEESSETRSATLNTGRYRGVRSIETIGDVK
jgi:RimJ/RimL family protein N-acetyltransferase